MPDYEFRACDHQGNIIEGRERAESLASMQTLLNRRELHPIKITEPGKKKKPMSVEESIARMLPVPKGQIAFFYDQMASLLDSGIPIVEAIRAIEEQLSNRRLRDAVEKLRRQVEGGIPLHEAMFEASDIFDKTAIRIIEAGETSGQLDVTLVHLAEMVEFEMDVTRRFREATRYPKIVLSTLFVAGGVLIAFVVPKFAQLFQKAEVDLPWTTQLLINAQRFITEGWGVALLLGLFGYAAPLMLEKDARFVVAFETVKLKVPIFGALELKLEMSRVFKILSVMIKSGVDILTSLHLASQVSRHRLVAHAFMAVRSRLEDGDSISNSLKNMPLFPKMSRRMIMLGDKSGQLSEALNKVSAIYEKQTSETLKKLGGMVEPLLIVIIGVMILIFALGIFLPMWDLMKVIK